MVRAVKWARRRPAAAAALIGVCLLALAAFGVGAAVARDRLNDRHAEDLVRALVTAEIARVPLIVRDLDDFRGWADPRLRRALPRAEPGSPQRLRLALGLLPTDTTQADTLSHRLPTATPAEVSVIREALRPVRRSQVPRLWAVLRDGRADRPQRLGAAAALAALDPANPDWGPYHADVAGWLVATNRFLLDEWADLFRAVRRGLLPHLEPIFSGREPSEERTAAAYLLAGYADDPAAVVGWLRRGDSDQVRVFSARLSAFGPRGADLAEGALAGAAPGERANLALALLPLGRGGRVWPLFRHGPDDDLRTRLIRHCWAAGIDPAVLIRHLGEEADASIRRALVLSLGEYPAAQLPRSERAALTPWLLKAHRDDPDSGLHSAAEWLLRRWGVTRPAGHGTDDPAANGPTDGRRWYTDRHGFTFAVIRGPVVFEMGSPPDEPGRHDDEARHARRIGRSFAIATTETTLAQYRQYEPKAGQGREPTLSPDAPVTGLNYIECVRYCRWLSQRDGLTEEQMCYPDPAPLQRGDLQGASVRLDRPGYRLPTEAEWEYACRAGTTTALPFGRSEEFLSRNAWWLGQGSSAPRPVGELKPNDLGLFDGLGNAEEWCLDTYAPYRSRPSPAPAEDDATLGPDPHVVVRGASSFNSAPRLRSAACFRQHFRYPLPFVGFRVARTVARPTQE